MTPSFMTERRKPSSEELDKYLRSTSNWGRWGKDDEVGALNLITPEKRRQAATLVKTGQVLSLANDLPKTPGGGNARPVFHSLQWVSKEEGGGYSNDFFTSLTHQGTHLDALCHVWEDGDGMYNGRDPKTTLTYDHANFGTIDRWSTGIVTKAVLLDVPRHRGKPFVEIDDPVMGWELEDIQKAQGVTVGPGDAIVVYAGQAAYRRAGGVAAAHGSGLKRPGLDATCVAYMRERDVAVLLWDMNDPQPYGYDLSFEVHYGILWHGMAFIDGANLEELADLCAKEKRYEFMLSASPLRLAGATGSPINPLAIL
jgi:kynurenine formamidase